MTEPSPGDVTEAALCELIGEVLGIGNVTGDEDFFDLGGTSLKAAVLIAEIDRRFGVRPTLADLYEASTGAGLIQRLAAAPPGPDTEVPIFLVHWYTTDLVREIGRRRPVYILSYGLNAEQRESLWPLPVGVDALAAHYLAQLRRIRPVGPYHLVGPSVGGVIAWEMARQLQASGAEPGLLCLIDVQPPGRPVARTGVIRAMSSLPSKVLLDKALRRLVNESSRIVARAEARLPQSLQRRRWEKSDQFERLRAIDHRMNAYRMRPLRGRLLLIEAQQRQPSALADPSPAMAESYAQLGLVPDGYSLVQLPGDHTSVARGAFAERVAAAIEREVSA